MVFVAFVVYVVCDMVDEESESCCISVIFSFGWFGIGMCVSRFTGEVGSLAWEICGGSPNTRGCVIVWWGGGVG